MLIHTKKCIYLLPLIISCLAFGGQSDSLTLRILPEMEKHTIRAIDVLNPDFALALGNSILLKWDGVKWGEFVPAPFDIPYHPRHVQAFAADNIWLFYHDRRGIYYTKVVRFDGERWRPVKMTQPGELRSYQFVDANTCLVGGGWGSLGVIKDYEMTNIAAPPNVANEVVAAFSADHFLTRMDVDEYSKSKPLFEYRDGEWTARPEWPLFTHEYFYSPDSAVGISSDGVFCKIVGNTILPVDTLATHVTYTIDQRQWTADQSVHFWRDDTLFFYKDGRIEIVSSVNFSPGIHHVSSGEYFLINAGNLFYLGPRKVGEPYSRKQAHFWRSELRKHNEQLGVSFYRNERGNTDVYLTSPYRKNVFLTAAKMSTMEFVDELSDRGLHGLTRKAGDPLQPYDASAFFADIDNDGDMDAIMAALRGECILYENGGNDRFRNVTQGSGLHLKGRIYVIRWLDIDGDGNLDVAVGDNLWPLRFFRGDGNFRFEELTRQIALPGEFPSYLPEFADTDNDGDLDLLLYSRFKRVRYFKNNLNRVHGLPVYTESSDSPQLTTRFDYCVQSVSWNDFDEDGDIDLFLVNRMSGLKLFENDGSGNYQDISAAAGFDQQLLAYSSNWGDFDQDGDKDLFVSTIGNNIIFWNQNNGTFSMDSKLFPVEGVEYSTGSGTADLDEDGDLDIVVANSELGETCIYTNLADRGSLMRVSAEGRTSNRNGVGARVSIYSSAAAGEPSRLLATAEISLNKGYCSSALPEAEFTVGENQQVDIEVRFASGKKVVQHGKRGGGRVVIVEPRSWLEAGNSSFVYLHSMLVHPSRRRLTIFCFGFLAVFVTGYRLLRRFFWTREQTIRAIVPLLIVFLFVLFFYPFGYSPWWSLLIYATAMNIGGMSTLPFVIKERGSRSLTRLHRMLTNFQHGKVGIRHLEHILFLEKKKSSGQLTMEMSERIKSELGAFIETGAQELNKILYEAGLANIDVFQLDRLRSLLKRLNRWYLRHGRDRRAMSSAQAIQLFASVQQLKTGILQLGSIVEARVACSLKEAVNQAILLTFREANINLVQDLPAKDYRVVIPQNLLVGIISDILQNAIEATAGAGRKSIRIFAADPVSAIIQLFIEDNGPGITDALKEQILLSGFSTKNDGESQVGDHGQGLGLAKEHLGQFGGSIALSREGTLGGACFVITLKIIKLEQFEVK